MTSNRPYLIRALYEWILDNDMTPHLLVDTSRSPTVVPTQFVQDGKIVLNLSPSAVRQLVIGNDEIVFNARFSGRPMDVLVPIAAVMGIYARENGHGMLFPEDEVEAGASPAAEDEPTPPPQPKRGKPNLRVVK
ncbi:MAG TPA: ClpXP protease specificity-enhancing factor [Chromatiaceae bacterium]|nr:ClpXP protease specificity-enhancing factor [Chromatiaceae bacterium]